MTPRPWRILSPHDGFVYGPQPIDGSPWLDACYCPEEDNARLIVRCVNAHDDLVAALQRAREFCDLCHTRPLRTLELIDAALAKARGEP